MNHRPLVWFSVVTLAVCAVSCSSSMQKGDTSEKSDRKATSTSMAQVPTWSQKDLDFFLHGSMSTEFAPENVLRAFMRVYPDLFPSQDLGHLGLIPDPNFGWPIGFSRNKVLHLGG